MDTIKRGDVYFVDIPYYVGAECRKNRPAVIVSNDVLNATSPLVSVVYCSMSCKKNMVTHVKLEDIGEGWGASTALCEAVYTIDKSRLIRYCGHLGGDSMEIIDKALRIGLGLDEWRTTDNVEKHAEAPFVPDAVRMERDFYKNLYNTLLDRLCGEARQR